MQARTKKPAVPAKKQAKDTPSHTQDKSPARKKPAQPAKSAADKVFVKAFNPDTQARRKFSVEAKKLVGSSFAQALAYLRTFTPGEGWTLKIRIPSQVGVLA